MTQVTDCCLKNSTAKLMLSIPNLFSSSAAIWWLEMCISYMFYNSHMMLCLKIKSSIKCMVQIFQHFSPQAMKKIYKACLKYPEWKRKHEPNLKPWRYPEQNTLPCITVADLTVQRADSLENIDESSVSEEKAQHHSDDDET